MTQAELSEKSGVGTNTLSRLEHGSEATVRTVRRLARALQVSPYELTEMDPDRPPTTGGDPAAIQHAIGQAGTSTFTGTTVNSPMDPSAFGLPSNDDQPEKPE